MLILTQQLDLQNRDLGVLSCCISLRNMFLSCTILNYFSLPIITPGTVSILI